MATQIVIANGDSIKVDDSFHMGWADKGKGEGFMCPRRMNSYFVRSHTYPASSMDGRVSYVLYSLLIHSKVNRRCVSGGGSTYGHIRLIHVSGLFPNGNIDRCVGMIDIQ